jgi:hypothetical protein
MTLKGSSESLEVYMTICEIHLVAMILFSMMGLMLPNEKGMAVMLKY